MAIQPIAVVERVLAEYRDYLATEFRARDKSLRAELERALEEQGFLSNEPFFQAHRPFKDGLPWQDLGLDVRLADVMERTTERKVSYLHQSEAILHLLSPKATATVVTTGTGSGKTECFLLPIIQNAIADGVRFGKRPGLTAVLVYPMNALANDQETRISSYLRESGHDWIQVKRYDRRTTTEERAEMRRNPPQILLTNYMMLEYLLVRPSDRDNLFKDHRVRFVVLDEVHTYRGVLGANIALLYRRLVAHLAAAEQTWKIEDRNDAARFPKLIPVATSATIKSIEEGGRAPEEVAKLRTEAVQEFVGTLTGAEKSSIRVLGEDLKDLELPSEARWTPRPAAVEPPIDGSLESVRKCLAALSGAPATATQEIAARSAAVLWLLADLLARKPLSVSGIVTRIQQQVPERRDADPVAIRKEVEAALVAGASLPDGTAGALRLRAHRIIRGGWRFHRCLNPECGRITPRGEDTCAREGCGYPTAPLYICRSCGTDVVRFERAEDVEAEPLRPTDARLEKNEVVLYDLERIKETLDEDEEFGDDDKEMKGQAVLKGSFDPKSLMFSKDVNRYGRQAMLAPARNRCLVCGAFGGAGSVITPVALGTSAAVRVISEGIVEALALQHQGMKGHDGKERLLIFSDSRQDAAHQARFITYAGRYDRMRARVMKVLRAAGRGLPIEEIVRELLQLGIKAKDNVHALLVEDAKYLGDAVRERATAWEEAPLLDDLAVSANYRGTIFNLGLVGVRYQHLDAWVADKGGDVAKELGLDTRGLLHVCRCFLDEMRRRLAFSRPMLQAHPQNSNYPEAFRLADWERRFKRPIGFSCDEDGTPLGWMDDAEVPDGVMRNNMWRKAKGAGAAPSLQKRFTNLVNRLGGKAPTEAGLLEVIRLLQRNNFVETAKLTGFKGARKLLQVNAGQVLLEELKPADRFKCGLCNLRIPWSYPGAPCPACAGKLEAWPEQEVVASRSVQRILRPTFVPLNAGEHTAQVSGERRHEIEEKFKAASKVSTLNVLACSPTLEMGIDIGGLDAIVMRNIPPRPDNYAQRGGRAGRRARVGVVLSYARNTPHDGYFYDHPEEMIGGEVAAPGIGLGNRDVILRHLHAIAFGMADPGLAGRMIEYVDLEGGLKKEKVDELIAAISAKAPAAAELALKAWGSQVLAPAELDALEKLKAALVELPAKIRSVFERVQYQVQQLQQRIEVWKRMGQGTGIAINAMNLIKRLLGLGDDKKKEGAEADDRSGGHPMRRFAEFGILPGYEFPDEPSTLRLLGDPHEEEPITVERRFGIAQFAPDATVHARGHRWEVKGLDLGSPWNPRSEEADWVYVICKGCELRYEAQGHAKCPRCGESKAGSEMPAYSFGGFAARRDDTPVLEEEDRFAVLSLVSGYPQWDGEIKSRFRVGTGWTAEVRHREEVRWLNESRKLSAREKLTDIPRLHEDARGVYLCPKCGMSLSCPERPKGKKGQAKPQKKGAGDPYGHMKDCADTGQRPKPLALLAREVTTTLRLVVTLPADFDEDEYQTWGQSLGFALRRGMRQLYTLDGPEVEFVLEPMWTPSGVKAPLSRGALTFVDPALGGSGFLDRAAKDLNHVAEQALIHLKHEGCESACYRCLKSYTNQRVHKLLSWPRVVPDLEQLASVPPEALAVGAKENDDIKPWLEAFEAGVGSPLELQFLKLFEKHGLAVEKQVEVSATEGARAISVADFAIPASLIAIYVDGAAFHRGERLRRDRVIRQKLASGNPPWRVVELRAPDLRRGEDLIKQLKNS